MRKYVAEFIGTAVLVFFGCGSAVSANALFSAMGMGLPVAFTTLLIAVAFGLAMAAMVYTMGNISGGHLNPAVSLGMLICKRMSVIDFIGYVIAQVIGAIAGAALLGAVISGFTSLGANGYGDASTFGISMLNAIIIEVILTFVFVSVVLSVTDKFENSAVSGMVIGLSLTLVYLFGIPFTGASANPARSVGPAVMQLVGGDSTAVSQLWIFIVAPLVGAVIAALVYKFLNAKPKEKVEIAEELLVGDESIEEESIEEESIEEEVIEEEVIPEIEPSTR